jgi:GST-like protein
MAVAGIAIRPWYGSGMSNGASYNGPGKSVQSHEFQNLTRWTKEIGPRLALMVRRMVDRAPGRPKGDCTSAMAPDQKSSQNV